MNFSGSPVVETFSAVWIPGQRAKIPYASWPKKKTKNKTYNRSSIFNKFSKGLRNTGPHQEIF